MGQMMNLFYEFDKASVYDIHEVNSSFASGSLKVLYLGENRNGSYFSKDAVERALPSLKNVPIVCHWDYEACEIGGHDMDVVTDNDGNLRLRNLTEPCGVVPEHATFRFVTDTDEDGNEHEYLVVDDVLLWKRQDVYRHIVDDLQGHVKHSMEINVFNGENMKSGCFNVKQFEFTALCLLEKYEPCFQGSELTVYAHADFKQKMEQMMAELKEYYYTVNSADNTSSDDTLVSNITEGGKNALENTVENIDNVVYAVYETGTADNAEVFADAVEDAVVEADTVETGPSSESEFTLNSTIVEELNRKIDEIATVDMPWGACPRYWYVDCNLDNHEVYCYDTADWKLYGFTFDVNGDAITIDLESKRRMKYNIVPFEGEDINTSTVFEKMFAVIGEKFTKCSEWEGKYNEASNSLEAINEELTGLRQYKADSELAKARAEKEELFSTFDDLVGIEAFDSLVANADDYDLSAIEEKCYAIRGRNTTVAKYALNNKSTKLVVSAPNSGAQDNIDDDDPYGGIVARYINKHNK